MVKYGAQMIVEKTGLDNDDKPLVSELLHLSTEAGC